ncbi:ABC transporter substrate-binding protein [Gorillibacterium timonense]|uniref:ABC transporter substrate-binding protein n=1 Tax=Gorillibacterium timonense TaxID=1689269 RepID=UPI00071CF032|nr:ABC transporter substrate-binding protein [Gorillibacterium timonense]
MKFKKMGLWAAVLALATALSACSSGGKDAATNSPAGNSTAPSEATQSQTFKNELNIAVTAQPPTLDTAITVSAITFDISGNIFEQLYTLNANYEPVPQLAESVETSTDGLTYTFALRHGVKFHNGKEMTAEDVVASMNRWLTTNSRAKLLLPNAKFEQVDPYSVKLTVEKATSDVLLLLSSHAQFPSIMPKEAVESATADGIKEYIGTGPYKFKEWKQDQYISLEKFDDYQGVTAEASGYSGAKEAPTKTLTFHFVSDASTRIAGIKTGKYDVAASIPSESYDELAANTKIELHTYPGGALTAFLNTSNGLLASNDKYRQAILAALNDEEISLASYVKPELYSLAPGFMNPKQAQWSTDAGGELYNQANTDKAKQLLKEAGYNGQEITLLTTKDYAEMYTATLVIQEQLTKIGMKVKVDNYDFPTFLETKGDRSKWDLFVASTGYQLTPPQILAVNPDWAGLNNETVKNSVVAIREAATPEDAKKQWENVQKTLYEYGAATVLSHYNGVIATVKSIEGFQIQDSLIVWNAKVPE